jgi:hypothetical protein
MLTEIGDYEELSSNMDRADDWQGDAGEAALWLEDYWRVTGESGQRETQGGVFDDDRLLAAPAPDGFEAEEPGDAAGPLPEEDDGPPIPEIAAMVAEQELAGALSLPPRYMELARAAQQAGSWMLRVLRDESLPIRLAVYHKLLGAADDTYPDAWLDPATGELPTLQQLAALDRISMPTLRKRRNEAIDKLHAASTAQ